MISGNNLEAFWEKYRGKCPMVKPYTPQDGHDPDKFEPLCERKGSTVLIQCHYGTCPFMYWLEMRERG